MLKYIIWFPASLLLCWHYRISRSSRTFTFQGRTYKYFIHRYNRTWNKSRAVEIPIIWGVLSEFKDKEILEVGNVLPHYFPVSHDIVDKYEKGRGVINEDILSFQPGGKYDLIISISTIEHIGWDPPEPREPVKALKAIEHLKNLLAPGGKLVVTIPLGHHSELDRMLKEGRIEFTKTYCLKRIDKKNNIWVETTWEEAKDSRDKVVVIGIFEKDYSKQ